ncbi:hypothetical protein ACFYS8_14310 [Kitasatospora sp. NPDC004615]|uniref:hypothetical protein n=1 Tax=Kitasatospora sp. NPDC004615 TaxID=3364017 RepID=UPI0036A0B32C
MAATAATAATATATTHPAPSVHVRALITWMAVFPSITVVQLLLGPSLSDLAVPLRVLAITALVVPAVVYLFVPGLLKARVALLRRRAR